MSKVHSFAGCLKAEFLRLILSPKTYLSVLLVAFAFGLSVRISGFDISWGDGVYFLGLAMNQSNTHLLLILSVGISFSTAFLEDWKHRYTLAQVIRAGTGSYAGARVIVCFVGAWTAAFLGIHLFLGLISLKIPVMSETFYEMYAYAPYGALAYSRFPYLYVLVIAAIISAGLAFWAVAGLLVSVCFPNVFVAAGMPVMLSFYITVFAGDLPQPVNLSLMGRYGDVGFGLWGSFLYTLFFFLALTALMGVFFYKIVKGRVSGEIH